MTEYRSAAPPFSASVRVTTDAYIHSERAFFAARLGVTYKGTGPRRNRVGSLQRLLRPELFRRCGEPKHSLAADRLALPVSYRSIDWLVKPHHFEIVN
jgi:hypothetical protein